MMDNENLVTIGKKGYIISKLICLPIAIIVTSVLLIISYNLMLHITTNIEEAISLNFVIVLVGFIIFLFIDCLIISTLILGKIIKYDNNGITAGSKQILWAQILKVEITFGQSPIIKVRYKENDKEKNVLGLLRTYPTKKYLDSIENIFYSNGI